GAGGDVVAGEVVEGGGAVRREADVHHPARAGRIDARVRALDVVTGQACELWLVARLRTTGDVGVLDPFRVDELGHRADRLLGLCRVHPSEVDSDAVVVGAGTADLGLADVERVDTLVD